MPSRDEQGPKGPTPPWREPGPDEARVFDREELEAAEREAEAEAYPPDTRTAEMRQGHEVPEKPVYVSGSHPSNRAHLHRYTKAEVVRAAVVAGILGLLAGFALRATVFDGGTSSNPNPDVFTKEDEIEGWEVICTGTKNVSVMQGDTYSGLTAKITTISPQEGQPALPQAIAERMNAERNDDDIDEIKAGQAKALFTNCAPNFEQPPTTTAATSTTTG